MKHVVFRPNADKMQKKTKCKLDKMQNKYNANITKCKYDKIQIKQKANETKCK